MTKFELPELPYDYDSLEPFIDEETLHFHHDKHHATYAEKFNEAISKYPKIADCPIEEIFRDLINMPADIQMVVKNHGGGYINHNLYFGSLTPNGGEPEGALKEIIVRDFGSFDSLKKALSDAALNQFGSGYAWLVKDMSGKLRAYSLPNQDSPYSLGDVPLLPIDVWEHAYYLKYKNARKDYIENIWNIINWEKVSERYLA